MSHDLVRSEIALFMISILQSYCNLKHSLNFVEIIISSSQENKRLMIFEVNLAARIEWEVGIISCSFTCTCALLSHTTVSDVNQILSD